MTHEEFIAEIEKMTVLELNDLVKALEEKFGVSAAAPVAVAGFFSYNGLTLEQFLWAFLKSEVLCAGKRVFRSENFYYRALGRKEDRDFD